jgi:hypothetical protein
MKKSRFILPELARDPSIPFHNGLAGKRPNQQITDPGFVMEGSLPSPEYLKLVYGDSYTSNTNGIFQDAEGMTIEQKARLMKNPWLLMDAYPHDSVMPAEK